MRNSTRLSFIVFTLLGRCLGSKSQLIKNCLEQQDSNFCIDEKLISANGLRLAEAIISESISAYPNPDLLFEITLQAAHSDEMQAILYKTGHNGKTAAHNLIEKLIRFNFQY
jgi:hypothetical protein